MTNRRVFLGWNRPGLGVAADYLAQRFGSPGRLDMSGVVAIVPGARSGADSWKSSLGERKKRKVAFHPPRIETPGRLPELFYQPKFPFANALTQQLAWMEAVRRFDPARLKQILSVLPQETDLLAWLSLGEMLARLHRELAAEGLDFADVAEKGTKLAEFREAPRWRTLAEIQQNYLNILDRLEVWDVQTARRVAVEHAECRTDMDIVLIGLADMNRSLRQMLDQVSSHVTALVLAPPELADRFDPYGCLALAPWLEATMDLADHQIELVDDPADQSQAAVRAIAALGGGYRGEQITLGVPDTRILPYLQQHLRQAGVPPATVLVCPSRKPARAGCSPRQSGISKTISFHLWPCSCATLPSTNGWNARRLARTTSLGSTNTTRGTCLTIWTKPQGAGAGSRDWGAGRTTSRCVGTGGQSTGTIRWGRNVPWRCGAQRFSIFWQVFTGIGGSIGRRKRIGSCWRSAMRFGKCSRSTGRSPIRSHPT